MKSKKTAAALTVLAMFILAMAIPAAANEKSELLAQLGLSSEKTAALKQSDNDAPLKSCYTEIPKPKTKVVEISCFHEPAKQHKTLWVAEAAKLPACAPYSCTAPQTEKLVPAAKAAVQIAALANCKKAEAFGAKAAKAGFQDIQIIPAEIGGKTIYRIRVVSDGSAKALLAKLAAKGFKGFIVK